MIRKVFRLTWFLACDQDSLVGLCVQYYKSLCADITISATLVNIQTRINTQRKHFDQLVRKAQPAEQKRIHIFSTAH